LFPDRIADDASDKNIEFLEQLPVAADHEFSNNSKYIVEELMDHQQEIVLGVEVVHQHFFGIAQLYCIKFASNLELGS
jgi:hypothetical protein